MKKNHDYKTSIKPVHLAVLMSLSALPMQSWAEEPVINKAETQQQTPTLAADDTLPTVVVEDSSIVEDGYRASVTRVGKTLQDPHDIPQAVTTVTNQLMHDQQIGSLKEALRNVSGLTFNAAEGGRAGDNMMLRGFYTFGDMYLDGIRDTAQYNRETFNLEQVDVLRGSAAMLFGRGQAGGVINQVSKTAKLKDEYKLSSSVGDYGYQQYTADLNKTLGDTIALRINVMDREEEATRKNPSNGDRPEMDRQGIALSLGFGIGTDNELFINHVDTQTRDVPDYGIRFSEKKPIGKFYNTFWGTDANFDDSDTRVTTAAFTHKFSEETQWRTQVRKGSYERAYWVKTPPGGPDPFNADLPTPTASVGGNIGRKLDYETLTVQSDISTAFELMGMRHEVMGGVEYLNEDSYRQSLRNLSTDPDRPNYNKNAVTLDGAGLNEFDSDSYSYFLQDTIEFIPNWKLLVGARRDHMDADYIRGVNVGGGVIEKQPSDLKYSETSYRTGLSWQPTPTSHYYVSYSDSFSPTADLYQLTVNPYPPETSKTVEIGSKWLFLDGNLAFRTAIYRSEKKWERNTDLESTASILTKKRRTDGLELEVAGRITDNWEVFAGLALMDAKILEAAENTNATTGVVTEADPRFEGERARNTPPMTFNLWTTYKFYGNWKVGGGVEVKGERYGYVPSQSALQTSAAPNGVFANGSFKPNTIPSYTRWDAMLAYEEQKWALRLNVKNLFDTEYYDALYDNGSLVVPGNGRTVIMTTELKF